MSFLFSFLFNLISAFLEILSLIHEDISNMPFQRLKTEDTDRCELPHRGWELNLGPLQEQPVLLVLNRCFWNNVFI